MFKRLADGYATRFIQERPDLTLITDWLSSPRSAAAALAFRDSTNSKKPGRVAERIIKHVRPAFSGLKVAQWDKEVKAVFTVRMSSALETDVFDMMFDEKKMFSERSVILSDLLFFARGEHRSTNINISANISHHAISRLLERGASTPETIKGDVLEILQQARALRQYLSSAIEHSLTKLKDGTTYDLIIPHGDGGLVVRTMRINTVAKTFFSDPMPIFSVRTFLDGSMLGARERERMVGFRMSRDPIVSVNDAHHTLAWIQGNAEEIAPERRFLISQYPYNDET